MQRNEKDADWSSAKNETKEAKNARKHKRAHYVEVSFVCGYHQARVVELVGTVDVGSSVHQVLDDVQSTVVTSRTERSGNGGSCVVQLSARSGQSLETDTG